MSVQTTPESRVILMYSRLQNAIRIPFLQGTEQSRSALFHYPIPIPYDPCNLNN